MKVSALKEDLVFIGAIFICQVINIIAFVCGAINHVAIMLMPVISLVIIVCMRYSFMLVKLLILAIKEHNRKNNESDLH